MLMCKRKMADILSEESDSENQDGDCVLDEVTVSSCSEEEVSYEKKHLVFTSITIRICLFFILNI